jgi:hypothetical protein
MVAELMGQEAGPPPGSEVPGSPDRDAAVADSRHWSPAEELPVCGPAQPALPSPSSNPGDPAATAGDVSFDGDPAAADSWHSSALAGAAS